MVLLVKTMWKKVIVLLGVLLLAGVLVFIFIGGEDVSVAKDGDVVKVHYNGTFEDGTVFDSSELYGPLEFTIGRGAYLPSFESAVEGMRVGDKKTITIPSDQAYGPYSDELIFEIERSQLSEELNSSIEVGQQLEMYHEIGTFVVVVIAVSETMVTVDANSPLAGRDLTFEIELVEILS